MTDGMLVHDPNAVRLGRLPKPPDARDLNLANYLVPSALPAIPDPVDVTDGLVDWGMLLNDKLGDCTIAAALHLVMVWARNSGRGDFYPTDAEALAGYEAACGYVNGDPSTDQGGIERNVLKFWKKRGFAGHRVAAFVAVDPTNADELEAALYLFDGVYLGVDLKVAQQQQQVWDYVPGSAEWGGHAIPLVAWDKIAGTGTVVTWGATKGVTGAFMTQQCTEAWAVLSADMLNAAGGGPAGLNLTALRSDLGKLTTVV